MRTVILIFLLGTFSVQAQIPKACTRMGCVEGLTFEVAETYRWKPGFYQFVFRVDGQKISCRARLPLNSNCASAVVCDSEKVSIGESGCALPASAQGFGPIHFESHPGEVHIRIDRNKKTITKKTYKPEYQTVHPNGPECGPVCKQSQQKLDLR